MLNSYVEKVSDFATLKKEFKVTVKGTGQTGPTKEELQTILNKYYTEDRIQNFTTKETADLKNCTYDLQLPCIFRRSALQMILLSLEILLFRNIGLNLQFIHTVFARTYDILTFEITNCKYYFTFSLIFLFQFFFNSFPFRLTSTSSSPL